jgi:small-conductance mechanosensitive channel
MPKVPQWIVMARSPQRQSPNRPPAYPPSRSPLAQQPADRELQQRAWAALLLAIISLFGMMMIGNVQRGVYVVAVALLIAAAAVWLAISAASRARRAGSARPRGVILATVLGVIGLVFSAIVLAGFAMFWPQLTQYSRCLSGANTVSAQQACQQQLNGSVGNEIGIIGG